MAFVQETWHWLLASNREGLQPLDWLLLLLYAASTIALGWHFGRRQKSTEEYFVGSGNMNPFLIGVSLFATLLSTISYLSMPGEALGKGPVQNALFLVTLPLIYVTVAFGLLPVYMRQRVTSAYELLEEKLGLSIRLLGACMFLALRLVWMSLLIYLAAKAFAVMLGVDYWIVTPGDWQNLIAPAKGAIPGWYRVNGDEIHVAAVPAIVLVTGFVALIYTSVGGLRAVVITDFMQTLLLFGGAWLVILTVTLTLGGVGWFPTSWQENWDIQPIFPTSPKTRVTVVGTVLTVFIWFVATLGGDQTTVQRFMATRDATAARFALAFQLSVSAIVAMTLLLVGFSLLGYYQTPVEVERNGKIVQMSRSEVEFPANVNLRDKADNVFPHHIPRHLPVGIVGLVVAAMFAAAMSSIDSGVNSITAVVTTDFLDRFGLKPQTERGHVFVARLLAFGIGAVVVIGSSYMKYVPGNITAVTQKTVNLLTTPIFALFFFALFVPFAKPIGVWAGAICGTLTAALLAFSGPLVYLLWAQFGVYPEVFDVSLIALPNQITAAELPAASANVVGLIGSPMGQGPLLATSALAPTQFTAPDPVSFQWIGPVALAVNLAVGTIVSAMLKSKK